MKYDNGKTDLSLIPPEVLVDVADVLGFGAKKYGRDNHRIDGHKTEWSRTYASIQRHLHDFWAGEDIDPESGQKHITHAICQLVILATAINDGHTNMDDRFTTRFKKNQTPESPNPVNSFNSIDDYNQPNFMYGNFSGTQLTGDVAEAIKESTSHIKPNNGDVSWKLGDNHTTLYYNKESGIINEYSPAEDEVLRRALNADS